MAEGKTKAALESGVAALALALVANGFKVEEGADPIEVAIAAVKGQAAKIDELENNASAAAIAAVARADKAEAELDAATKELEELRTDVKDLEERIDVLQADALANAADPVNEAPPALERPEGARDFGPSFGRLEAAELAALIENGDDFELAFSNGKFELVELAPITIPAKDLLARAGRFQVGPAVHVRGGEEQTDLIDGVALVQGGEQLDYCQFPRPLTIEPKQERRFERALTFG